MSRLPESLKKPTSAKTGIPNNATESGRPRSGNRRRVRATVGRRIGNYLRRLRNWCAQKILYPILRTVWTVAWRFGAIGLAIFAGAVVYCYSMLPDSGDLLDGRTRGSVLMLDRSGQPFAWRGEQFGGPVSSDSVSPDLKNAVLATEDRRFYRHFGISPRGIAGAVYINLREGRGPLSGHGGSTITQQVGKLLCLGVPYDPNGGMSESEYEKDCRRNTLWRKIKEVPFAVALEWKYTKDDILSIYLNRAYLGAGAIGFEAASQIYFGKPSNAVTRIRSGDARGFAYRPVVLRAHEQSGTGAATRELGNFANAPPTVFNR